MNNKQNNFTLIVTSIPNWNELLILWLIGTIVKQAKKAEVGGEEGNEDSINSLVLSLFIPVKTKIKKNVGGDGEGKRGKKHEVWSIYFISSRTFCRRGDSISD